jgi:hydrogenase nickel incorporation protein HypA/HybF
MHEALLAMRLVELASQAALQAGAKRVLALRVFCGALRGVAPAALMSAFEVAAVGTAVEGAVLEMHAETLAAFCTLCQQNFSPALGADWLCPSCGRAGSLLSVSRDVELKDITVDS